MTVSNNNMDIENSNSKGIQLPKRITIESEKKCTVSGEYEIQGPVSTAVYVSKGELMPLYCGKKVKWSLIRNG